MSLESDILSDLRQLLTEHGVSARWQGIDLLEMYGLTSSMAAGKDARATEVRASCPDANGLMHSSKTKPFPGAAQDV